MFEPLRKYATFSGRARRREFWLWWLFYSVTLTVLTLLAKPVFEPGMTTPTSFENTTMTAVLILTALVLLLPTLAVQVRRLHDANFSGWWILLSLTGVGNLVLLIMCLLEGTKGANRFGADPKGNLA